MQKIVKNKQYKVNIMPITEQLILMVDAETDLQETPEFTDKKNNAIIGALLADLFLQKKAGLVNNKVVVTTTEGSRVKYIDDFITKLRSLDRKDLMENIIHEVKPLASYFEDEILKKLLAEQWLVEKKGLLPVISQKKLQVENSDYLKAFQATITNILANEEEPKKEVIYLMAILYSLNMLQKFTKKGKLGREEKIRMNELLEKEYLAKLIYRAIKNQPDPKSIKLIDMRQRGYIAGMRGLMGVNR